MSIITAIRPSVKVSSPRRSSRPVRPFGQGVLASCLHFIVTDHSVSDEAWLIADNAAREAAMLDQLAGEFIALDRLERGIAL
jgi:hypothetical protein